MTWTYSDLKTKAGQWLKRSDLSQQIDDAIVLFESEYASRKNVWRKQSVATITTESEEETEDLPADYEGMVTFERVGFPGRIKVTTIEGLKLYRVGTGEPDYAAVYPDNKLLFAPTPDGEYEYELIYNARLEGLSGDNATNWLLEKYPHVYLYGVLSYMLDYVQDAERALLIKTQHQSNMTMLESQGGLLPEHDFTATAEQSMP